HEFAIAAALASINKRAKYKAASENDFTSGDEANERAGFDDKANERAAFRSSLFPVLFKHSKFVWAESNSSASAVWGNRQLAENLAAVLHRREVEAQMSASSHPFINGARAASLDAIADFLNGASEQHQRIEGLLLGLSLFNWRGTPSYLPSQRDDAAPVRLSRVYALMKLLFLPEGTLAYSPNHKPFVITHEPRIVPLLAANRVDEAIAIAFRRLVATGLTPLTTDYCYPRDSGARLAAALLIPISQDNTGRLARLVLRRPDEDQR
ncbi:MAG: hypothetical protein M3R15_27205, partial [Acidobacteriota bacterium]|nr:hypothetical protein [Acidobacteriota bacterium]